MNNRIIRPGEIEPSIQADTPIITPDGTFVGLDQALSHFIGLSQQQQAELSRLKLERGNELRLFAGALELLHEHGVDAGLTVDDLSAASDRRTERLQPRADEPPTT